jgi:hypothetical protein
MPDPAPRSQRLARIRRTVLGGTIALFIASLGAVVTWGRQPAQTHARAVTQDNPSTVDPYSNSDGYGTDQYGTDPYSYGGDGYGEDDSGGSSQVDPSQSAPADPGPLTSRSS